MVFRDPWPNHAMVPFNESLWSTVWPVTHKSPGDPDIKHSNLIKRTPKELSLDNIWLVGIKTFQCHISINSSLVEGNTVDVLHQHESFSSLKFQIVWRCLVNHLYEEEEKTFTLCFFMCCWNTIWFPCCYDLRFCVLWLFWDGKIAPSHPQIFSIIYFLIFTSSLFSPTSL